MKRQSSISGTVTTKETNKKQCQLKRMALPNEYDRIYREWLIVHIDSELDPIMIRIHIIPRLYDMNCFIGHGRSAFDALNPLTRVHGFNSLFTPLSVLIDIIETSKIYYIILTQSKESGRRVIVGRTDYHNQVLLRSNIGQRKCNHDESFCVKCEAVALFAKTFQTLYDVYQDYATDDDQTCSVIFEEIFSIV